MKLLFAFATIVALCAGSSIYGPEYIPTTPGDNSHYVEGVSRYIWMPDGEGVPHLVDLQEPVPEVTPMSGARNNYWLYTRQNPQNHQLLVLNDNNSVRNSNYNGNLPLKVIVHGWNSDGSSSINPTIRDAFLAVGDFNVIVLDWGGEANSLYTISASAVPGVGQQLGNFLNWLISNHGGNWNNVHLVGFSLGAHVVGNAGRTVGNRARRVTGLDPAGPQWGPSNANTLRASDGGYVETIHTDGGLLGIHDPIANSDFYPNGGRNAQPGCWQSVCSHGRAWELFASSVRTNHFIGRLCANISQANNNQCTGAELRMGNSDLNKSGSGLYGLVTGATWPF